MRYAELSLRIVPLLDGSYTAIVEQSPAGKGRVTFHSPFEGQAPSPGLDPKDLARDARPRHRPSALSPREMGDLLFRAVFSGPVRSLLENNLSRIGDRSGRGLRIKIHLDSGSRELQSLSWEHLYWRDRQTFVGLNSRSPIVRSLNVPRQIAPLRVKSALRTLAMAAAPAGVPPLDLDRERKALEKACSRIPDVDLSFLETPTAPALLRALKGPAFHILHFMGHGTFDPDTGIGSLLFESGTGGMRPAPGEALAQILGESGSFRLAVLNACNTALSAVDPKSGLQAAGVASSLCLAGVPAVVAMQVPISDPAAITFSEVFYAALTAGDPVDTAVTEARRAIWAEDLWLLPPGSALQRALPWRSSRSRRSPPPVESRNSDLESSKRLLDGALIRFKWFPYATGRKIVQPPPPPGRADTEDHVLQLAPGDGRRPRSGPSSSRPKARSGGRGHLPSTGSISLSTRSTSARTAAR